MKKILLCVAAYEGDKKDFFERYISPRNREFAEVQGYEYVEIKERSDFRHCLNWDKPFHIKRMIDDGTVKEGDHITVIDADICIVDATKPLWSEKPFTYAIDSCNSHCLGYYSIKICDWSVKFFNNLIDDDLYKRNLHDGRWGWAEQAAFYHLAGIEFDYTKSFFQYPNYSYGSCPNADTIYTPEELIENIEVRDQNYNVTYVESHLDPPSYLSIYYHNHNRFEDIVLRHWGGGQMWNERYFEIPLKK